MKPLNGIWSWKARDDMRVSLFQIPEIMQVAIRENNDAAVLGLGVFTGLFLADERILILGFRFEYDQGETPSLTRRAAHPSQRLSSGRLPPKADQAARRK